MRMPDIPCVNIGAAKAACNPSRKSSHGSVRSPEPAGEVTGLVNKKTIACAVAASTRSVENWMASGLIPFVRLSPRCVRFHLPSVIAALRRLEVKEVR